MTFKHTFTLCATVFTLTHSVFALTAPPLAPNNYSERSLALQVREWLTASQNPAAKINALKGAKQPLPLEAWLNSSALSESASITLSNTKKQKASTVKIAETLEIPEVWLYEPSSNVIPHTQPDWLVAYVPDGNESNWRYIEAFDLQGNTHMLDPFSAPDRPVLVVETRGHLRLKAVVEKMNAAFQQAGLSNRAQPQTKALLSPLAPAAPQTETAMQLTQIRANDVEEPWIKGDAEVYAIASGVRSDENDPTLKAIALPYLDEKDTNYYPNQLILFRSDYTYPVANLQFFEDDGDDVNYKNLIRSLVSAVGSIADLAQQPQISAITTIANEILNAMPNEWFADNDDYVDSCYTLEFYKSYHQYTCARNNITLSAKPFELKP